VSPARTEASMGLRWPVLRFVAARNDTGHGARSGRQAGLGATGGPLRAQPVDFGERRPRLLSSRMSVRFAPNDHSHRRGALHIVSIVNNNNKNRRARFGRLIACQPTRQKCIPPDRRGIEYTIREQWIGVMTASEPCRVRGAGEFVRTGWAQSLYCNNRPRPAPPRAFIFRRKRRRQAAQ
jgi:hypothetical protein